MIVCAHSTASTCYVTGDCIVLLGGRFSPSVAISRIKERARRASCFDRKEITPGQKKVRCFLLRAQVVVVAGAHRREQTQISRQGAGQKARLHNEIAGVPQPSCLLGQRAG